jgi:hypothetical protein
MKKKLAISFLIIVFFLLLPQSALALKIRSSRGASSTRVYSTAGRVGSSVKFNGGRNGVIISFSGLSNAKSVTYTLSYNTNGIAQGAMGTISNITTSTDTRELLFGTCSGGVCRYHQNITNAKLVITSKLNSGYTTRKTYKIRI